LLTPIVYNLNTLPTNLQALFAYNPLYALVRSYQNVLVYNKPPAWHELGTLVIVTAVLALLALVMFRKSSAEMVDAL
jgi:lipopolysaccharide transport system permease protein